MFFRKKDDRTSRGSFLSLLALFCMATLIGGLLIVNYTSQTSLQGANNTLFQQNLEDSGRSMSYFFSERENNIRALAASAPVTAYFANQALGMTMAYGLRASLNNIKRRFEEHGTTSRLGKAPIYTHLVLLDTNGSVLAAWPETVDGIQDLPAAASVSNNRVEVVSGGDGRISFTAPVSQNERVLGYVRGWVSYRTLVDYLLEDMAGTLIITAGQTIAFQSGTAVSLRAGQLQSLIEHRGSPLTTAAGQLGEATPPLTLYHAAVPGYDIILTLLDERGAIGQRSSRFLFMATLTILSVGVFAAATFIWRMGSRRMVLETSLAETIKREQAVSEKKEEMELVIQGAQLGTWSWNIASGQVEFNERYGGMLGYAKTELPQHIDSWRGLLHPDDADHMVPLLEAHLAGTTSSFSAEYRMRHKSGHWIWIHNSGKMLQRDADGRPLHAFGIHLDITERKESAGLLARAKEESDAIIRNFLDTLIVVNTALMVVRVNQATCDLLGADERQLIGRHVAELFHDDPALVRAAFAFYADDDLRGPMMTEELRNIELCYRHANGGRLPMSFNISLLKDDHSAITGVVAGAKDVSGLRSALDQIDRQKRYIETLFDIVPTGLVAISPEGKIVTCNRAFTSLGTTWSQRLAIGSEEWTGTLVGRITTRKNQNETFILPIQHGQEVGYFRCSLVRLSALAGIASVVSVEDITDERKAEDERKLLATVIDQTGDSVFIVGIDEIVRYVNPAAINSSGYSEAELVGSLPPIYSSDLMDGAVIADLRKTLAEGRTWHGPFRSRRKDGSIIEEDASISPIRNEEGEIVCIVGVKRDITEKVTLQRQLLQSQKLEAIGQLAAGIAHEINTPMQYIQNNVTFFDQSFTDLHKLLDTLRRADDAGLPDATVSLMADLDLDFLLEELPASIRETHDGIDRVVKIVAAMKEFSHPGSSDKTATDLNHNLENTLIVCRNEWKYVADLVTDFDPALPPVPCFPDQLNQAFLNLVINASHAVQARRETSPDQPGRINVTTRRDGNWVEIRVEDNGTGIPDAVRERIFDPFFTTKQVGKGTGQGLAIAHDTIVNKHGGTIDFTSVWGEGTTFVIRLPLAEAGKNRRHGETSS